MKRRHFLQTGSVGALGFILPAGLLHLNGSATQNIHQWLAQLASATGTRRRSSLLVWSADLQQKMLETNQDLASHGFFPENSALYFYSSGQSHFFYPLVLRHRVSGMTEFLVPVFGRQSNGAWRKLTVLTSYQIEALAHAAQALAEQELSLQEVLLPAGIQKTYGPEYNTSRGVVSTMTRLHNGAATTHLTVRQGDETIYNHTILSQHNLSTTATIPA